MANLIQLSQTVIPDLQPNLLPNILQAQDADREGFNNLGDNANTYVNTWTNTARLINGQGGDDSITTGGGNDEIYGGSGNDTIKSGAGWDELYGGAGNDISKVRTVTTCSTVDTETTRYTAAWAVTR